jgi:hypothetical protein
MLTPFWIQIRRPDPDFLIRSGYDNQIRILPTGSGFTDRIYSIFADEILISRPDPDLPTEFIDRIWICRLDPDSPIGSGFFDQIWISQPDPHLMTRSRFAEQIWICGPDPDHFLIVSGLADRIRICRPDLDSPT